MADSPNLFYKIIHAEKPFTVACRLADIAEEPWGIQCERPLVLFADPQEAMEKSLWFYSHNILPLIGEPSNLPVTIFAAKRYGIDAIVGDISILQEFWPHLAAAYDVGRITALTLVGRQVRLADLQTFDRPGIEVRAVLALSALGPLAVSCALEFARGVLVFHPVSTAVRVVDGEIVIVKTASHDGAAARHTGIPATRLAGECICGAAIRLAV